MVAGALKLGAPTADSRGMRLPSPRRMPRLGNVRLSVKLGLCFGAILALTAAIVAVDARQRRRPRERARARDDRRRAAHHRRPARRHGLRRPPLRPDADGAHQAAALRATRWTTSRSSRPPRRPARPRRRSALDDRDRRRRQAVRGRGRQALRARQARRHGSAPPTSSRATVDEAADNVIAAIERLHHAANRERAAADERFATPRPAPRAPRSSSARWPCWSRSRLALGARPPPRRAACAPLSRAAEALAAGRRRPRALRRAAATRSGAPPPPWPRWSSTSATLAGAADRVAAGDLTVDVSAALRARPPRRRLRRPRGRAARRREPDVALGHQRGRRLGARRFVVGRRRPRGRGDRPRAGRRRLGQPSARCAR